jgi:hypothetical protein
MTDSWDIGAAREMSDRARRAQQAVNDLGAGPPLQVPAGMLAAAAVSADAYDRILREIPPTQAATRMRNHRLREAADQMRAALAALTAGPPPLAAEPRRWLYGLTADEWFHLAAEGQDSEVAPCCGDIGEFREWLNALATCQGKGEAYILLGTVLEAYESAAADHDTLRDATVFPLLHRVLGGIRAQQAAGPLLSARTPEPEVRS